MNVTYRSWNRCDKPSTNYHKQQQTEFCVILTNLEALRRLQTIKDRVLLLLLFLLLLLLSQYLACCKRKLQEQVTTNVTVRQTSNDCVNTKVFKRCLNVATDEWWETDNFIADNLKWSLKVISGLIISRYIVYKLSNYKLLTTWMIMRKFPISKVGPFQ